MDDPTRPAKKQLQVNGSTLIPRSAPLPCSPSPTSFHWEQYFFSRVPSQGLYLTRSKSFPYYLLAIALSLFQTSSSGFVLLDRVFGLFIPSFFHLSLRFSCRYISWRPSKPFHCGAFTLLGTYFRALFHISSFCFVFTSLFIINLKNITIL